MIVNGRKVNDSYPLPPGTFYVFPKIVCDWIESQRYIGEDPYPGKDIVEAEYLPVKRNIDHPFKKFKEKL